MKIIEHSEPLFPEDDGSAHVAAGAAALTRAASPAEPWVLEARPRVPLPADWTVEAAPAKRPWWRPFHGRRLRDAVLETLPRRLLLRRLPRRAHPAVLLTFDDGPNPHVTPAVLDCLDRHGARAVFFVVGRFARREPGLVREILSRGHVLGNHTQLHHNRLYVTERPGLVRYWRDVARCQETIAAAAGRAPRLFRPPGGRITPTTLLVPLCLGLQCVSWSLDSGDWRIRTSRHAREAAAGALARIEQGDVVLLHDNRPTTVELLEAFLPVLRARGFDLATGVDAL